MSSPRAAKAAGTEPPPAAEAEVARLVAVIERGLADGRTDMLAPETVQQLMAAVCRLYAAKVEAGEMELPLQGRESITSTDVMTTASGLLKASNLAVFELGMWQSWTGR